MFKKAEEASYGCIFRAGPRVGGLCDPGHNTERSAHSQPCSGRVPSPQPHPGPSSLHLCPTVRATLPEIRALCSVTFRTAVPQPEPVVGVGDGPVLAHSEPFVSVLPQYR